MTHRDSYDMREWQFHKVQTIIYCNTYFVLIVSPCRPYSSRLANNVLRLFDFGKNRMFPFAMAEQNLLPAMTFLD